MNRRDAITGSLVTAVAVVTGTRPPQRSALPCIRMRIETGGRQHAGFWRVFDAETGYEIGRDIPAERWAAKFAKAEIGQPFHFTVFKRDEKGRVMVGSGHTVQERRRGVIIAKI